MFHTDRNEFDLHGNERASKTHFQMKGFATGFVLTEANGLLKIALFDFKTR